MPLFPSQPALLKTQVISPPEKIYNTIQLLISICKSPTYKAIEFEVVATEFTGDYIDRHGIVDPILTNLALEVDKGTEASHHNL